RIRRRAHAEAEAAIIKAEAKVIAEGVVARARRRNEWLENRRQENIEYITSLAFKFLPETVEAEPVNPDWTTRFLQDSQDVTDELMQSLWAQLLAGEVSKPGSYSPRTLSIVRDMRHEDAIAFTKFATFVWHQQTDAFVMLRTFEQQSWNRANITYDD